MSLAKIFIRLVNSLAIFFLLFFVLGKFNSAFATTGTISNGTGQTLIYSAAYNIIDGSVNDYVDPQSTIHWAATIENNSDSFYSTTLTVTVPSELADRYSLDGSEWTFSGGYGYQTVSVLPHSSVIKIWGGALNNVEVYKVTSNISTSDGSMNTSATVTVLALWQIIIENQSSNLTYVWVRVSDKNGNLKIDHRTSYPLDPGQTYIDLWGTFNCDYNPFTASWSTDGSNWRTDSVSSNPFTVRNNQIGSIRITVPPSPPPPTPTPPPGVTPSPTPTPTSPPAYCPPDAQWCVPADVCINNGGTPIEDNGWCASSADDCCRVGPPPTPPPKPTWHCYKCSARRFWGECTYWYTASYEAMSVNICYNQAYWPSDPTARAKVQQCYNDYQWECNNPPYWCDGAFQIFVAADCECWPECNAAGTFFFFEPSSPSAGTGFYIKVESNTGYINVGLTGTDGLGRAVTPIWDGVFGGEHGYTNQWRWHLTSSVAGTYNFVFSVSGGGCGGANCKTGQVTVATPCDKTYKNDKFHACYFDGINPDVPLVPLVQEDDTTSDPKPLGSATTPVTSAIALDHNWGMGQVTPTVKIDNVSGIWRGNINFSDGVYTFSTENDDGAYLELGNQAIIQDWNAHPVKVNTSSPLRLQAGYQPLTLRWFEQTGSARIKLSWVHTPITCTVDLFAVPSDLQPGSTGDLVASVNILPTSPVMNWEDEVANIKFTSDSSKVSILDPSQVAPPDHTATMRGEDVTTGVQMTALVTLNNGQTCTDSTTVTVSSPGPWFQTQGGDVHAQFNIFSPISGSVLLPDTSRFFSLGLDPYPGLFASGLVSYGDISADFGQGGGAVSEPGWLADSRLSLAKASYDYFYRKLGEPTTAFDCGANWSGPTGLNSLSNGFYLANGGGDCVMNQSQILAWGTRKLVVFVDGNLTLESAFKGIDVDPGGFFAFIVKGDINISGNVGNKTPGSFAGTSADLQGIYLTNGTLNTYIDEPADRGLGSGNRLVFGGLSYNGTNVFLKRYLKPNCLTDPICDANTPAELFIFRPDLVVNAPREFWYSKISWVEVAP